MTLGLLFAIVVMLALWVAVSMFWWNVGKAVWYAVGNARARRKTSTKRR